MVETPLSRPLERLRRRLAGAVAAGRGGVLPYAVPGLWVNPYGEPARQLVNPYRFHLNRVEDILKRPPRPLPLGAGGEWSRRAVVYSMLVRASTAFDHDGDGRLGLEPIGEGWRETGTFVKAIAMLPAIRSMGFNTVHLLPVGAVGRDGRKGTLGSAYAVRDPCQLDPTLGEPALGLGVDEEFAAFVQAAHHLGMRVVVEFALRTAALDADWAAEHPEWFYWIRADVPDRRAGEILEEAYGAPLFAREELGRIREQAARRDMEGLLPPHRAHQQMFTPPPSPFSLHREGDRWIGILAGGVRVRIAGAFADWPPDDPQPPWTDVTYLRLYDHPDFNYVAYNTVRMYDRRLAQPANAVRPLWRRIVEVVPSYQRRFGVDGAVLDMGHALPLELRRQIVGAARVENPDFAFWDETFSHGDELAGEGYNAVVGNYWWLVWRPERLLADLLSPLAGAGLPLAFLAAPESHNTPRAAERPGGLPAARLAWALGCLLPAIPFCHSGLELAETVPVNTGLDFRSEDLPRYPPESLALFSALSYGWETQPNLVQWVAQSLAVRDGWCDLVANPDPATFELLASGNRHVWAVVRSDGGKGLAGVVNLDAERSQSFSLHLAAGRPVLSSLPSGASWSCSGGRLEGEWPPAGCVLFEL